MNHRSIVLSDFGAAVDFTYATDKCEYPVTVVRSGDISSYNGKSFLSMVILLGWNVEVQYDERDETKLRRVLFKYGTSENSGWRNYIMKQHLDDALMTGEKEIDENHLKMLRLFNYIADACDHENLGQARRIMQDLAVFVTEHLCQEEQLQREYAYPEAEEHLRQHDILRDAVRHLYRKLYQERVDFGNLTDYIYHGFFILFFEHIREHDQKMCIYLAEHMRQE